MWLSSAGIGMLAPGKQVGNAAIVPSFVKVPCTISSMRAFASGDCMSYLAFVFSLMAILKHSGAGVSPALAPLRLAGETPAPLFRQPRSSPHPNGQGGILLSSG